MEKIEAEKNDDKFKDQVSARAGGENIKLCFACGTCTAACPVAAVDEEFNPRRIIRQVLFGKRRSVLSSPVIWRCQQCYACYATCPQNVKFRDVIRALRAMAVAEGYVKQESVAEMDKIDRLASEVRNNLAKCLLADRAKYEAMKTQIQTGMKG